MMLLYTTIIIIKCVVVVVVNKEIEEASGVFIQMDDYIMPPKDAVYKIIGNRPTSKCN